MPVLLQSQGCAGLLQDPLQGRRSEPADQVGAQVFRLQEGAHSHDASRRAAERQQRDHQPDLQGRRAGPAKGARVLLSLFSLSAQRAGLPCLALMGASRA